MPGSIKIDDGSGNYTILTNAGSLGSDKTLTLPNETATLATTNGIKEIDSFQITANVTSNGDLTSNWQRSTATGFAKIGTGMTESSGIFTFPSTGIYEIQAVIGFETRNQASPQIQIQVTTNNSSFSSALQIFGGERANAGGTAVSHTGSIYVDVTDTTQVKVKFTSANLNSTNQVLSSTTLFNFKRLADT